MLTRLHKRYAQLVKPGSQSASRNESVEPGSMDPDLDQQRLDRFERGK